MDFNSLLEDLRIASENLVKNSSNRKPLSTVYCHKISKAVDKVSTWHSDYESVITGLWVIGSHFTEYIDHLAQVPSLKEAASRLFRECAKAVLNIQWQNLEEDNDVRQKFIISQANLNGKLVPLNFLRFRLLETLLENPWTDPTLAKIMGGEAEDDEEKEEVRSYIEKEDAVILQLRVDMMLKENCEEYALNLCNSCLLHPELKRDLKLRKTQLSLLYKLGHRDKLQEECQNLSIQEAVLIIKQLQTRATKEICTILAQTFMVQHWIRQSDHKANKELLRLWIKHQSLADKDQDRFKESVWAIAKLSQSTDQILFFIDILREQCGKTYIQLYVDMCIFAINVDKGQMEDNIKHGKTDLVKARKEDMAAICGKLACLNHHTSIKVARVSALTAFALKPSIEMFTSISKFYGSEKDKCCTSCNNQKADFGNGIVNPATLYEVERLLCMLRPDYLNPDDSFSNIKLLCERFCKENNLNILLEPPPAPLPVPQDSQLRVVQIEGFGKPKATSVKPSNVFEAVPSPNVSNAQAIFRQRFQTMQNKNFRPSLSSTPQNLQGPPAHYSRPTILQSGPRYNPPTVQIHMKSGGTTSTLQQQQQQLIYRNIQPSVASNMPQQHYMYSQSNHTNSTQQGQAKNLTKLNPQLIQYIQSAVRQNSSALQDLMKHPDKDIVRTVLNMMDQTGMTGSHRSLLPQQQQQQQIRMVNPKRLPTTPSGLPTVSTLLKAPTNSLHHGQAPTSSVQQHSSSSSVSTHTHLVPKSPYPHQINDHPSSQTSSSSCSPSFNSLSDQQKVESFRLAKVQAGNIRSAMQSCISTTGPQQKQQILAKQMSGSTIIVNQPPHFQGYSGASKAPNQVGNANLHNRAISQRPSMNLERKLTGNEYSITVSSRPSQHNAIMSAGSKTQQQQAQQQPSRNNPALFNQNTGGLASFGGSQQQQQSSSHQKQSFVLSSDELSGSIMGIDDTIITELLQDSGLLANTFPDIEVDFNLDDYFDKKREVKTSSSQHLVSQPMSIDNKIALSSSSSSVLQRNAVSSSLNNTINFAQNQSSFLSSNNTGSSPRTNLGYIKQNFPFTESSSFPLTTMSVKPKIHTDTNSLNQRQFPDEIATNFDLVQPAQSSNSRSWSLEQMSVEQIREVMKQEQIEGEVTMDSSNNATYRCIICSLAFQILEDLREHVRNVCKPGLQSSSVYNNKIKQDRANSAKAGLETTTVFQCLRCFELCISDVGIKQHRLTCKRVPTVPLDIKNATLTKAKTPPSSRCSTPKASMPPKTPPKTPPTYADNSSKLPDMPLPFPFPSLNTQEVLNTLQAVAASGKMMKARDNSVLLPPSDISHSHTSNNNVSTTTQPAPSTTTTTTADCKKETLISHQVKPEMTKKENAIKPPEKPDNLPPMNYSEISGSGGSKFYRCKNCAQTLCSFESLCSHWKECATKPLVLSASRNHRPFPLEQEEELEEGEIRPLVGKVLQNVLDVIKAVAKGDIGDTPNLDKIDLANSDTETVFSLKNPCETEPPAKPSGKISKKEFPTRPFPGPDNGSKVDVAKGCTTAPNANRKISCLQMKDSTIKIEKDEKEDGRYIKLTRNASLKSGKSPKDFNVPKRDEEESETTEKEDEQSDNSERGTASKVEISRDVPPKLRDRTSRLKPVRFVSEAYVSPYKKSGLNKLNKPDTPSSMERRSDGEEKSASVSSNNNESGKSSPSKRKVKGNLEDTKNSNSSREVEDESFSCVVCSKSCPSRRILIQHYAGKHLQPYTMKTLTDGSSYFCHLCQKSFNTFMHYMHHVPNHASTILKKMAQFSNSSSSRSQLWSSRIAASRGITSATGQQKGKISPNRAKALQSKRKAAKSARARLKKTLLTTSAAKSSTTVSLNGEVGSGTLNPRRKTSRVLTRKSAQQMLQRKLLKRKIESKRAGFDKRFSMSENEDSCASSSPYVSDATDDDEYAASDEEVDSDSALQEPPRTRNRSRRSSVTEENNICVDKSVKVSSSSLAHFPELSKISNILPSVSVHRLTQSEVDRFTKSRENEALSVEPTMMTSIEQGPTDLFKVPPVENVKSPPSFQLSFESFLFSKNTPGKTGKDGIENKTQTITSPMTRSVVNSDMTCELTKDDDEDDHHSFASEDNIMISVKKRRCSVNLGQKVDVGILKTKPEDGKESCATESSGTPQKNNATIGKEALHLPSCAVLLEKDEELVQQKMTIPENLSTVLSPEKQSTVLSAQENTEVDITDKKTDSLVSTSAHPPLESDGKPDLPNETVKTAEQKEQNSLVDSVRVEDSSVSENTIESGKSEKESACVDSSSGQSMEDDKRAKNTSSTDDDVGAVCEDKSDIVFSADVAENDSLPQALPQSIPSEVVTNSAPLSLKEEEDQVSHLEGEGFPQQDSPQCIKTPITTGDSLGDETEKMRTEDKSNNSHQEIVTDNLGDETEKMRTEDKSNNSHQEIVTDNLGDETEKMRTEGKSNNSHQEIVTDNLEDETESVKIESGSSDDTHPSQIDKNEILNKSNIASDMKQLSAEIVTPEKGTRDNDVEESEEWIEDEASTEVGEENSCTECCEISASSIPILANDSVDCKEQESVDRMSETLDTSSKEKSLTDGSVVEALDTSSKEKSLTDTDRSVVESELEISKQPNENVLENGPKEEVDTIVNEVDIPIDVSVGIDLNKTDVCLEEDDNDKKQKDEIEEEVITGSSLDGHVKREEDITEVTLTEEKKEIDSLLPATASESERVEFESDNQGVSDSRGSKDYNISITDRGVDKDEQMGEEEDKVEVAIGETIDLSTACSGGMEGDEDAKSLVDLPRDSESKDVEKNTELSLETVVGVSQEIIQSDGQSERGDEESNCNLGLNKTEEETIDDDSTPNLNTEIMSLSVENIEEKSEFAAEEIVESKVDVGSGEMCNEKTIHTNVVETGETANVEMGVEVSNSCDDRSEEVSESEVSESKEEEVEQISDSSQLFTITKEGVNDTEITSLSVENIEEVSGEVTADVKLRESDLDGQDGCRRNREDDGENCDENVESIKEVEACVDGTAIVREDVLVSEVDERNDTSAEEVELSNVKDSLSLDKVTDTYRDSEGLEHGKEDEIQPGNDEDNDVMSDDGLSMPVVEACKSDEICNDNDMAGEEGSGDLNEPVVEEEEEEGMNKWDHNEMKTEDNGNVVRLNEDEKVIEQGGMCSDTVLVGGKNSEEVEDSKDSSGFITDKTNEDDNGRKEIKDLIVDDPNEEHQICTEEENTQIDFPYVVSTKDCASDSCVDIEGLNESSATLVNTRRQNNDSASDVSDVEIGNVVTTLEVDELNVVEEEEKTEDIKSQDCLESGREEKTEDIKSQDCLESGREENTECEDSQTKEEEDEAEEIQDIDFLSETEPTSGHQDIISRVESSSDPDTSLERGVETCKDSETNNSEVGNISNDDKLEVDAASVSTPFDLPDIDTEDVIRVDDVPKTVVTGEEEATTSNAQLMDTTWQTNDMNSDNISNVETKVMIKDSGDSDNVSDVEIRNVVISFEVDGIIDEMSPVFGEEEEEKTDNIKNQDSDREDKTECKDSETKEEEDEKAEEIQDIDFLFETETASDHQDIISRVEPSSSSSSNFDRNSLERDIGACKDSENNSFEPCKERDIEACKDSENNSTESRKDSENNSIEELKERDIEACKDSENNSIEWSKDSENNSIEWSKDSENNSIETNKDSENNSFETSKDSENNSTESSKDSENNSFETSKDSENNSIESSKDLENNSTDSCKDSENISTESSKDSENNSIETSKDRENNSTETSKDSENNSTESSKDSENNSIETSRDSENNSIESSKDLENNSTDSSKDSENNSTETSKDSENNSIETSKDSENISTELRKDSENNSIETSKDRENNSTETSKDSENNSTESSKDCENNSIETSKDNSIESRKDSENNSTESSKDSENNIIETSKDSENNSIETNKDRENNSTESSKDSENNSIETSKDSENNSIETNKDSENNSTESSKDSENNSIETNKDSENNSIETSKDSENNSIETSKDSENNSTESSKDSENNSIETSKDRENNSIETSKDRENNSIETSKDRENNSIETSKDRENNSTESSKDRENNSIETSKDSENNSIETSKDSENNSEVGNISNDEKLDVDSASVSTLLDLPNIDTEDVRVDSELETVDTEEEAKDKRCVSEEEKKKEIITERTEKEESCPIEEQEIVGKSFVEEAQETVGKNFDEREQETSNEILRIGEGERMLSFEDSTDIKSQDNTEGKDDATKPGKREVRKRKRKSSRNISQDQATVGGQPKSLRTRRRVYYGNQSKQLDVEKGDEERVENCTENDNAINDGCPVEKISDGRMGEELELSVGDRKDVEQGEEDTEEGRDVRVNEKNDSVLEDENVDENRSDLGGISEDKILVTETDKDERSFGDNTSDLDLSGYVEVQSEEVIEKEKSYEEIQRDGNGDVEGLSSEVTTKEEGEFEDEARKEGLTEDSAICDEENNTGSLEVKPLNQNTGKEEEGEDLHTESVLDEDKDSDGEMRNRIKASDSDCVVTTSEVDGMPPVVEEEEKTEDIKSQDCFESGREEKPECEDSETGTKEEDEEAEEIQDIDFLSDYDTPPSGHQDINSRVKISYRYSSNFDTDWNSLGKGVETCKDNGNKTTSNDEKLEVDAASVSTPFDLPDIDTEDVRVDGEPKTVVTGEDATDKEVDNEDRPYTDDNNKKVVREEEKEIMKERKEEEEKSCPIEVQESHTETVGRSFDEEEQETSNEILRIGEGERMLSFEDSTDTKSQDGIGGREDVRDSGKKEVRGRKRKRKSSGKIAQEQATVAGQHKSLRTRRRVYYGNQSKQPDVENGDGERVENCTELEINKENDNVISDGCTEEKILDGRIGEGLELSVGERKDVGQEEGPDVHANEENDQVLEDENVDENRRDLGGNSEDKILEGETHKEERRSFGDLDLSGNVEVQSEELVEKEKSYEEIQRDGNGDVEWLSSVVTTKEKSEFEDEARKEGLTEDSAICGGLGVKYLNQNTEKEEYLLEEGSENLHTKSILEEDTIGKTGDDFSQAVDENSTPSKEDNSPYEETQMDCNDDDVKENMDEMRKAKNLLWDMVVRKRKSSAVGQSLSKRRMIEDESGEKAGKEPILVEKVKADDIAVEKEADGVEATGEAVEEENATVAKDEIKTDDLLFGNEEDDLSDYTLFIEEDKAPSKAYLGPFESDTKKKAKMNLQKEYAKKNKTRSVGSKRRSSKTDITKNSSPEKSSWLERKQKAFREKADALPFTWDLEEKPEIESIDESDITAETSVPSKLTVVQEKSVSLVCDNSSSIVEEPESTLKAKSKEIDTKTLKDAAKIDTLLSKFVKRSGRKRVASPSKEFPSSKSQTRLPSSLLQPPSESTSSTSLDLQHTPPKRGRKKKTDSSAKTCIITPLKLDTATPEVPPRNPNESPCFIEMDDDISFNIKSFSPTFTPDSSKSALLDKNNTSGIEPSSIEPPPPKKRGRPKKVPLPEKDTASCDFKNSKDSAGTDPKVKKAGLIPVTKPQAKIVPSAASNSVTISPVNPLSSTQQQQTCLNVKTVNSNNRKLIRNEKIQLISAKLAQKAKMSTTTSLQVLERGVVQSSTASASPLSKVVVSSSSSSKLKTASAMGSVKGKQRESLVKSRIEKKKDAKTGSRKEASPVSTAAVVKRRNPTPVRRPFDLPSTAVKRNQKPSSSIPNTTVYRVDPVPKAAKPKTSSTKDLSESDRTIHTPLPQGVTSVAKPKKTNAKKWKIDKQMKPTKVKAKQRKAPISFKRT